MCKELKCILEQAGLTHLKVVIKQVFVSENMNLNYNLSYSLQYVTLCKFLTILITLIEREGENALFTKL